MKRKSFWEVWLEDENKVKEDFDNYLKTKKIREEVEVKELVEGHLQKANHNLKFVKSTLDLEEFNDWAMYPHITQYITHHLHFVL